MPRDGRGGGSISRWPVAALCASPETVFGASGPLYGKSVPIWASAEAMRRPADMRSRMLTMPTSSPPSITGMWRKRRSLMIWAASLGEWYGRSVTGSGVMYDCTWPTSGCRLSAIARSRSRSVKMPTTAPPSTTTAAPTSRLRSARAASPSVADGSMVRTSPLLMKSRRVTAIRPILLAGGPQPHLEEELGVERVGDPHQRVELRRPPSPLQARDRGLRRAAQDREL